MAKNNPPRKKGSRVSNSIPAYRDTTTVRKFWMDHSDDEFRQRLLRYKPEQVRAMWINVIITIVITAAILAAIFFLGSR